MKLSFIGSLKRYLGLFGAILCLFLCLAEVAEAPIRPAPKYYTIKVRLTAYSSLQPREGNKNAMGKCARNEKGVAVARGLLPLGTRIQLPNGQIRIVDDHTSKWAARKFKGMLVDVRYFESIKSKPESRAVNKELRKYDKGWGEIKVFSK